ncbi:signal peptide peptidase SppA [bacterium]|nr:signal peptide peptidase SppA [bacterium]
MNEAKTSKIIILLCIVCLIAGIFSIDKNKAYTEVEGQNNTKIMSNANKVAVIELNGEIASDSESNLFASETDATNMLKSLKQAKDDKDIKGVILKINSPGGTVGMSQNIYNQIMTIRKNKPVISVFDDVAASGGYYIASASDRIVAQEGTLTGSIGVIFSFMDLHNLMANKLNIDNVVIKSGKYKDIGSSTRPMTDDERNLMQTIIDDSYAQFLDAIRMGRIKRNDTYNVQKTELTENTLTSYADGRVFTGRQAQKLGFVDVTGDIDTAKTMIETMMQQKYNNNHVAKLIKYNQKSSFSEYFSSFTEYKSRNIFKITDIVPTSVILSRRPLYLWE